MPTKTVRSRFSHEIGEKVEGCTILEKRVVIPPVPAERRLGVYDYEAVSYTHLDVYKRQVLGGTARPGLLPAGHAD